MAPILGPWAESLGWQLELARPGEVGFAQVRSIPGLAVVVGVGADLGGELARLASEGITVVAVEVTGIRPGERLSTVGEPGARHDQAGFLAGIMVGLTSRAGWVGLIDGTGGAQEAVYRNGFVHGLRYGCPRCRLVTLPPAEATVDAYRGQGVDAVFALPGPGAESALEKLAGAALWIVLVGHDSASIPPDQLAGQVRFEPEQALLRALEALLVGEAGSAWPTSLELGSMRIADLNPEAISPGRERLLREAIEALIAGDLDIGIDPRTGEGR